MLFDLHPSPEWIKSDPCTRMKYLRGSWETAALRAFSYVFDTRAEAISTAAEAGLFPSTEETSSDGKNTTIYVAPAQYGENQ